MERALESVRNYRSVEAQHAARTSGDGDWGKAERHYRRAARACEALRIAEEVLRGSLPPHLRHYK